MITQIVVPARDEGPFIEGLVDSLVRMFEPAPRVIVVDNASSDDTATLAHGAGADLVISEERIGKGYAVCAGLRACSPGQVFICDADISGLNSSMLEKLVEVTGSSGSPVGRLSIGRPAESAPVTTLVARPLLGLLGRGGDVKEPIGGLLLVERDYLLGTHLPGGWGFDFAVTLTLLKQGHLLPEVSVDGVDHRQRPLDAYVEMSAAVIKAALVCADHISWDHGDCTYCTLGVE